MSFRGVSWADSLIGVAYTLWYIATGKTPAPGGEVDACSATRVLSYSVVLMHRHCFIFTAVLKVMKVTFSVNCILLHSEILG